MGRPLPIRNLASFTSFRKLRFAGACDRRSHRCRRMLQARDILASCRPRERSHRCRRHHRHPSRHHHRHHYRSSRRPCHHHSRNLHPNHHHRRPSRCCYSRASPGGTSCQERTQRPANSETGLRKILRRATDYAWYPRRRRKTRNTIASSRPAQPRT
jgi:hypothetical protein